MTAKELLDAGQLSAALAQVTQEVKARPSDPQLRTFLFELLCFSGDLDRAAKQLDVVGQQNADSEIAVQGYRNVIKAEKNRRRLFSEGVRPRLPYAVPYADTYLRALDCLRQSQTGEARTLIEEAEETRPHLSGTLNQQAFEDFKDADDSIGPFLEAIIEYDYCWLPFEAVKSLSLDAPKHLRDLIWIPAKLELHTGSAGEVYLPVLYAGTYGQPDDRVKLGRTTAWREDIEELALGVGQKLFAAGDQDCAILEVRNLEFSNVHAQHT